MKYVAIEIKVKKDGTMEVSTFKKDDRPQAEKAYHSILTTAADSEHPVHAATLLNELGEKIKTEYYKHDGQAQGGQ